MNGLAKLFPKTSQVSCGLTPTSLLRYASFAIGYSMTKGLSSPHLLLAAANPLKLIQNLNHLLTAQELLKLTAELNANVSALFALGLDHFNFASTLTDADWRQKISRLYYGVYNVRRAVALKHSGAFSTDSTDHKNIDQLPDGLKNRESNLNNLRSLREDRNLADYSHSAVIANLVITPDQALIFATQFIADCRDFLNQNGLTI